MKNLNIREIRCQLGHLDQLLAKEGEVVVTRHGKPIARLLPVEAPRPKIRSLAAFRATMPFQEIPSEELVREDRDARD
ncbi:MAG: type II toxin-antitoxin system prevent-host-death family antitoxin [Pseudomonadota bacterium]|jgi:prevent-host-death family protein